MLSRSLRGLFQSLFLPLSTCLLLISSVFLFLLLRRLRFLLFVFSFLSLSLALSLSLYLSLCSFSLSFSFSPLSLFFSFSRCWFFLCFFSSLSLSLTLSRSLFFLFVAVGLPLSLFLLLLPLPARARAHTQQEHQRGWFGSPKNILNTRLPLNSSLQKTLQTCFFCLGSHLGPRKASISGLPQAIQHLPKHADYMCLNAGMPTKPLKAGPRMPSRAFGVLNSGCFVGMMPFERIKRASLGVFLRRPTKHSIIARFSPLGTPPKKAS